MNVLFLDDNPARTKVFLTYYPHADTVDTAVDCIKAMQQKPYDVVFLDHDLGGESFVDPLRDDCGMAVVRWITDPLKFTDPVSVYVVHSHNHRAAETMAELLEKKGRASVILREFKAMFPGYRGS